MPANPTRTQNLERIKTRLKVRDLPSKIKNDLPAKTIAIFANYPELDSVVRVIIDQNKKNKTANGRRAAAENKTEELESKLARFLNPSKSEIVQLWSKFFGKATTADDDTLNDIGAVSIETYNQTIFDINEEVSDYVEDSEHINAQLQIAKKLMSSDQIKKLGIEYKKWRARLD
jgi:hypothetical protein